MPMASLHVGLQWMIIFLSCTVTYGNSLMQIHTNDEALEILFKQGPSETGTILIDNENTEYEEIEINGKAAYLFEALTLEDYNTLLWQEEDIV